MIGSKYKEYVPFKHVYLDVVFGVYPVPEFYNIGEYPLHEVNGMTVCLEGDSRIYLEEVCNDAITYVKEEDLDDWDSLRRSLRDQIWYSEIKLFKSDMNKLLDACIRILKRRYGKEEE